jgi:NitT/TauT family transport system substrate-binding protein
MKRVVKGWGAILALLPLLVLAHVTDLRAEPAEVKVSRGFGITHLPTFVIQYEKLFEKHLAQAGLASTKPVWLLMDGGPQVNDAVLAGALDIANNGMPAFVTLWSRTHGSPSQIIGVAGLAGTPLYLNTLNPNVKTLHDFTDKDRIAVTGIKTGLGAVILQMAVAKEFGIENFAKLDPLTVGMQHPDAYQAIISRRTEVNTHFASPPFAFLEEKIPTIHRVVNSVDVLGNIHVMATYTPQRFADANPKIIAAYIAARDEAADIIARDPKRAAKAYLALANVKSTVDEVAEMIAHKDMNFAATPNGSMKIAEFLATIGTIKHKPADWKEMFVAPMRTRNGS